MNERSVGKLALIAFMCLVLTPAAVLAQSAIAGIVKDTSGAVLPGVTVEASSPALIEKTRSAVTDGQGAYKVLDLRPGIYSVTFTLPGFATIKREGLDLPANFTAPLNVEMAVGSVAETVTVAGASPTIDVQATSAQLALPQSVLEDIPTGRSAWGIGQLVPGLKTTTVDVGGTQGINEPFVSAHESDTKDATFLIDGMRVNSTESDGLVPAYFNPGMFSEMTFATSAIPVEYSGGGVRLNMIPKDGGNQFKGDIFFSGTNSGLQSPGLTPALTAAGLKAANTTQGMHDFNASVGGPILRDRLWFFASTRHWSVNTPIANSFYTLPNTPTLNTWTPDTSKQVVDDNWIFSTMARVTAQVNSKNRFAAYMDNPVKFRGHEQNSAGGVGGSEWAVESFSGRNLPGETAGRYYTAQGKWTGVWTDRLLFEAGYSINDQSPPTGEVIGSVLATDPIPKVDINTGAYWGAPSNPFINRVTFRRTAVTSLSYVTGSHALKIGMELSRGYMVKQYSFEQPGVNFVERFASGVPNSVLIYDTPVDERENLNADLGIYLSDNWTLKRLTVSPGIRFQYLNNGYPAQGVPLNAQQLLTSEGYNPRPTFPAYKPVADWKNWSPRVGAAYDLFGDGKTAVRANISRYQIAQSITYAAMFNPMIIQSDTRTWTDVNHDNIYEPGVDTLSAPTNANFGGVFSSPGPGVRRPNSTEFSTGINHEVGHGLTVGFGYYRRWYGNIFANQNPLLTSSSFTTINETNPCITNPSWNCAGTVLPTIPIYSISPSLVGQGNVIVYNSPTDTRHYNALEETFSYRKGRITIFGGFTTDRTLTQTCQTLATSFAAVSNPNAAFGCDQSQFHIPFQTQTNISGSVTLPYEFTAHVAFQSYIGSLTNAVFTATPKNTPGLVQASQSVNLLAPGSWVLPQINKLDLRLQRGFKFGRTRFDGQIDLFNALNARPFQVETTTAGPALNTPTTVLQPRIVSLGVQFHF